MLHPRPPNDILPMPIATTEPINTIHTGMLEGKFSASRSPVSTALPLPMVDGARSIHRFMAYSTMTHPRIDAAITTIAPSPK